MKKAKILLLEDDGNLSETVCEFLEDAGYEIVAVYDGESAREALYEQRFDLLLLDVNVPSPNGFELLKESRQNGVETPAIFLTSLHAIDDVEAGYESGADDYIRKPFALKELLLRIESMRKRNFFHHTKARIAIDAHISYDDTNAELYLDNEVVMLHQKEAKLLKLLMQRRGEVVTHEVIQEYLWDFDETPSDTALRTYIKNLRKRIGKDKIVSHKRLGYQLRTT
ncbi:MAG: DNA-binding response regulator [Sulfurimonas sp.]|nr:MAG: DNA-binding response regulator [Sulfurimonas sp.]